MDHPTGSDASAPVPEKPQPLPLPPPVRDSAIGLEYVPLPVHGPNSYVVTHASSPPLPLPALSLNYFTPSDGVRSDWFVIARCRSTGEWHETRRPLMNANIDARMGNGSDILPGRENEENQGIELLVSRADVPRAQAILQAHRSGLRYCPKCASTHVRDVPAGWYWYILAVLFMGYSPFWPAGKVCDACGKKWG